VAGEVVGPRRRIARGAVDLGDAVLVERRGGERLGEAPVDHHRLAVGAEQHVRRREVAVDDALTVGERDRLGRRDHRRQEREPLDQGRRLVDRRAQRAAVDHAHRVERRAVGPPADLVDRHDAGVLQAGREPRLALEPRRQRRRALEQLLHRHVAPDPQIARRHDAAHAAARHLQAELVVARVHLRQRDVIAGLVAGRRRAVGAPAARALRQVAAELIALRLLQRAEVAQREQQLEGRAIDRAAGLRPLPGHDGAPSRSR
jgi:hypothetical protein